MSTIADVARKAGVSVSTISNVLKTRHETAMNAIRNMKG